MKLDEKKTNKSVESKTVNKKQLSLICRQHQRKRVILL